MPRATKLPLLLLPLAALAAILPLLLHGISCGQDMPFHLQSWLDAADQLAHFDYPHWATTPAWNAGEPRFLFYPPLSWLLGAALTSVLPIAAAPIIYIFLALTASGLTMYHLARQYTSPTAALLAAAFYLANPYILFCAYERTAFAELLAAAWIPLLLAAIFKPRPTVRAIAIPIALLWLTNAPAAVMACYTFALLATLRVIVSLTSKIPSRNSSRATLAGPGFSQATLGYPDAGSPMLQHGVSSGLIQPEKVGGFSPWGVLSSESPLHLTLTYLYATILGLTLPAFYLIPAAYERRFVQVAMAIIPNMRVQDNFLFTTTADAAHNAVNHTASLLALTVLALTIATLTALFLTHRKDSSSQPHAQPEDTVISTGAKRSGETPAFAFRSNPTLLTALTLPTLLIAFLLTPFSLPLWLHLPNLQYLQFPWRLLTILSAILAFALALLLDRIPNKSVISTEAKRSGETPAFAFFSATTTLVLPLALTFLAYHLYAQACDTPSLPTSIATLFTTHHGAPPTDEYTPTQADNDLLRSNNPGYWFTPSDNPNAPAPNTTPTAAELNPSITTDDTPIPDAQTLSTPAPHHFTIHPTRPGTLILNLRDYPNWYISDTDECSLERYRPKHLSRDDGLIAIPIYCGGAAHTIDITWRYTPDQILGLCISGLALMLLLWSPEPGTRP